MIILSVLIQVSENLASKTDKLSYTNPPALKSTRKSTLFDKKRIIEINFNVTPFIRLLLYLNLIRYERVNNKLFLLFYLFLIGQNIFGIQKFLNNISALRRLPLPKIANIGHKRILMTSSFAHFKLPSA